MPPVELIVDKLEHAIGPAFGASAVIFLAVVLVGRRFASFGAAVAAAVAIGVGFVQSTVIGLEAERHYWPDWPSNPGWEWTPWLALAALLVGFLARAPFLAPWFAWLLRAGLANLAAGLLVSTDLRTAYWWAIPAVAITMLAQWALLEELCRKTPGGGIALCLAICAFGAAAVLIHAHSARLCDAATVVFATFLGLALIGTLTRADTGGAVPAFAVLLQGLLLSGQNDTYSDLPWYDFLISALVPLMLLPTALPWFKHMPVWQLRLLQIILVLIAVVAAIGIAVRFEELQY